MLSVTRTNRRELSRAGWLVGAGLTLCLVAGCSHPSAHPPLPVRTPLPPPPPAAAVPPTAPIVLPSLAELKDELSIVASPQISRERSLVTPGHVQDLGGAWVRYGPVQVGRVHPVIEKTGHASAPFTARIVVTHTQRCSDARPTQSGAAHAPLLYRQEQTTTYLYDYPVTPGQTGGTWTFEDEQDGPLLDRGKG